MKTIKKNGMFFGLGVVVFGVNAFASDAQSAQRPTQDQMQTQDQRAAAEQTLTQDQRKMQESRPVTEQRPAVTTATTDAVRTVPVRDSSIPTNVRDDASRTKMRDDMRGRRSEGRPMEMAAKPSMDQQMAEFIRLAQPGEAHKQLEAFVGKWNYSVKMWMDPKSKEETSKGASENTLIMGGRFIQQMAHGEATQNMPAFEGMGYTGFDNIKGEYNSFWLDNMGTGMMSATASFDARNKKFNEKGTYTCPMTKQSKPFRAVWTLLDKNAYKYEMFVNAPNGREYKSMEIAYTRAR